MIFLIAHTDHKGHNTAQATIFASSEEKAKKEFALVYPERVITAIGVR